MFQSTSIILSRLHFSNIEATRKEFFFFGVLMEMILIFFGGIFGKTFGNFIPFFQFFWKRKPTTRAIIPQKKTSPFSNKQYDNRYTTSSF